jgi:transcriptional regulator with GAF, ATPase, and Fis domain
MVNQPVISNSVIPVSSISKTSSGYSMPNPMCIRTEMDHVIAHPAPLYSAKDQYPDIVGSCAEMQKVYHLMSVVARTNSTVILLGETGTGKEVIARGIHQSSSRKNKPMVTINCATLPAHLIESELFGHEKGAFTGAHERRIGKFEMADQGTVFLDEIGEMPLDLQIKLLRVIQEREFERIGGKLTIRTDVRIIAATNRDLSAQVQAHQFRADLYYRLNVFPITLPPLRDREDDIAELANFFLHRFSKIMGKKISLITNKVICQLRAYTWPGNVRQLEHLIERSVLLSRGEVLKEICLPNDSCNKLIEKDLAENRTLAAVERKHIIAVLKKCGGKISGIGGAAKYLDLPATTLHAKMRKLNIVKTDYFYENG